MKEKIIKVKGSTILFDPSIKEFNIIFGERFFLNFETQKFEVDTNPYGDPLCIPILNLTNLNNGLRFEIKNNNIDVQTVITSQFPIDTIISKEMLLINNKGFLFSNDDTTKIEILIEKGKLKSIRLIKIIDFVSKDFLTFLLDEEQSFVIKYPFQKLQLNKLYFKDDSIVCENSEETILWKLSLPEDAIDFIKNVVELGLPSNIKEK